MENVQNNNAEEISVAHVMPISANDGLLTAEEELELAKRSAAGDEAAREKLVYCNQRLVAMVAFRYVGACHGLEFDDLKQAGNIGLLQAVKQFDYKKGFRFSTYAIWWIRQAITREISDKDRTIRIPVHVSEQLTKIRKTAAQIEQQTGNPATAQDVAAALDRPVKKIVGLWDMAWNNPTVSLDKPMGDDGDVTVENFLMIEDDNTPQSNADKDELRQQIGSAVSLLSPREQAVIKMRYGLDDGMPRTLEEVGAAYNVTRERVRQIELKALRKLRSPKVKAILNDFNN